jgi:antitoxin MazE
MEPAVKVSKWGNSLAIRLPAELVARLGLKDGDEIAVVEKGGALEVERKMSVDEAFAKLRSLRGRLPADFKFDREEANSRGRDDAD